MSLVEGRAEGCKLLTRSVHARGSLLSQLRPAALLLRGPPGPGAGLLPWNPGPRGTCLQGPVRGLPTLPEERLPPGTEPHSPPAITGAFRFADFKENKTGQLPRAKWGPQTRTPGWSVRRPPRRWAAGRPAPRGTEGIQAGGRRYLD